MINTSTKVNSFDILLGKIKTKRTCVGIVGVGYVGQPLAEATSEVGFRTIGFDIDQAKVEAVNSLNKNLLSATNNFEKLSESDIICICVPTPIDDSNKPDLSFVENAARNISKHLSRGQLVILESSVAPGTTREILLPILEESGLKAGDDFFLAYSPERIDPGNQEYNLMNTPRVVGGLDEKSTELVKSFYQSFVHNVLGVSSPEIAEMSKMLENTFRFVNIRLINELAEYANARGINIWEVINAAATKPYAFMPHYPSAGIGGHCIPVDPYYLIDDASKIGVTLRILSQAAIVNESRPRKVVEKAFELVNGNGRTDNNGNGKNAQPIKFLILGISYKAGSKDTRESAALKIWRVAESMGAQVSYYDPYVPKLNGWNSTKLTEKIIAEHDVIIIATEHKNIPYDIILSSGKPILDTKNIFRSNGLGRVYKY